jgi:hypothetical protein
MKGRPGASWQLNNKKETAIRGQYGRGGRSWLERAFWFYLLPKFIGKGKELDSGYQDEKD